MAAHFPSGFRLENPVPWRLDHSACGGGRGAAVLARLPPGARTGHFAGMVLQSQTWQGLAAMTNGWLLCRGKRSQVQQEQRCALLHARKEKVYRIQDRPFVKYCELRQKRAAAADS